jgi:hypothetical protein
MIMNMNFGKALKQFFASDAAGDSEPLQKSPFQRYLEATTRDPAAMLGASMGYPVVTLSEGKVVNRDYL